MPTSTMTSEIFREKQEINRKPHHVYDDKTIETMKQYFKVERDSDALLRYIKGNRISHDVLA
jgi:stalled ribosome alternative rescue factor ArfA